MKKERKLFCADEISAHVSSALQSVLAGMHEHTPLDDQSAYLLNAQVRDFQKKFVSPSRDTSELSLDAYLLFDTVNRRMKYVSTYPFPASQKFSVKLERDQRILIRAKNLIAQVLGEFDEDEFFAHCKNSSGSTVGTSYTDTSSEKKFQRMTHTEGVDRWFEYYLNYDFQLKRALGDKPRRYIQVNGSNAVTVPKDSKKVRMICVEPMLNMFFQQGLMHCLTTRLDKVGLSFESQQERNRDMAWYASITGSHATIDWSSASDTLCYELIHFLFPRKWFYYLDQFRSKYMNVLGGVEELHMFSTMGNACTFPIETLVFWSLACASSTISVEGTNTFDPLSFPGILVFGDDCIVPSAVAPVFLDFMERFGFLPNRHKTFLDGRFRESCGGDFLAGQDVRPYFLTGPESERISHLAPWLNIMFNRLQNRAIRLYGPLKYIYHFHEVFLAIFSLFRKYNLTIFLVPTYYPDDAGIKCGADLFRFLYLFRIRDILGKITVDSHGTKYFGYYSSVFPKRISSNPDIRYWLAIKGLSLRNLPYVSVRRHRSYVTARGVSPCFLINRDGKH